MNKRRKWRYNPIGEKYGILTVISEADKIIQPSGQKPRRFNCKCECGNETTVLGLHLVRGRIISCGCIQKIKNGESNTKLHKRYKAMIERCHSRYNLNYSAKGISVCEEWRNSYFAFKKWALENGYNDNLTIDRIDSNGNYEPSNCRFITARENCNNRSNTFFVEYNGEKKPITEVLSKLNKMQHYTTILNRIKRGWEHQNAIDSEIKTGNYKRSNLFYDRVKSQKLTS